MGPRNGTLVANAVHVLDNQVVRSGAGLQVKGGTVRLSNGALFERNQASRQ